MRQQVEVNPLRAKSPPKPPAGKPCPKCGWPVEAGDIFCSFCGHGLREIAPRSPTRAGEELFTCTNCGASWTIDPTQRSYTCEYCGSTFVFDRGSLALVGREPEFVLPFSISPEEARERFAHFVRGRWFVPRELRKKLASARPVGKYLPFWHFAVSADSTWSAEIGEFWYDSKNKVHRTEWWPLRGKFHRFLRGYFIPANNTVSEWEVNQVGPFWLEGFKRYRPEFLAGWVAENPTIPQEAALPSAEEAFHRDQERAIAEFLPGDTYRNLRVRTKITHLETDLVLLPLYIVDFRWGKGARRLIMNGQTGKIYGPIPRDWRRIVLTIVVVLAVLALASILINLFAPQTL